MTYTHRAGEPVVEADGMQVDIDGETWTYTENDAWTCPLYPQHVSLVEHISQYDFTVLHPGTKRPLTYAEVYEKIMQAAERGETVILDINEGMFRMTTDQALECWENLAPGEGFTWIEPDSEEAAQAMDLTTTEVSAAAEGDINDEATREFFTERGINTEEA